jgi:hypothetical protein
VTILKRASRKVLAEEAIDLLVKIEQEEPSCPVQFYRSIYFQWAGRFYQMILRTPDEQATRDPTFEKWVQSLSRL